MMGSRSRRGRKRLWWTGGVVRGGIFALEFAPSTQIACGALGGGLRTNAHYDVLDAVAAGVL